MEHITYDIETIPNYDKVSELPDIGKDSRIKLPEELTESKSIKNKDPEIQTEKRAADLKERQKAQILTVEKNIKDRKEQQIKDMALDPYLGRICAFGVKGTEIEEKDYLKEITDVDEKKLIVRLYDNIGLYDNTRRRLVGFNSLTFDNPFIYIRGMLLGVRPPLKPLSMFSKKYSHEDHMDLRLALSNGDQYKKGKLGDYGKWILNQEKEDIEYTELYNMIISGEGEKIAEACLQHTILQNDLYLKIAPFFVGIE